MDWLLHIGQHAISAIFTSIAVALLCILATQHVFKNKEM